MGGLRTTEGGHCGGRGGGGDDGRAYGTDIGVRLIVLAIRRRGRRKTALTLTLTSTTADIPIHSFHSRSRDVEKLRQRTTLRLPRQNRDTELVRSIGTKMI